LLLDFGSIWQDFFLQDCKFWASCDDMVDCHWQAVNCEMTCLLYQQKPLMNHELHGYMNFMVRKLCNKVPVDLTGL
jgi:hypothetical protein